MPLNDRMRLDALMEDAAAAIAAATDGPPDHLAYGEIMGRLRALAPVFPPTYAHAMAARFAETMQTMGPRGWAEVRERDPNFDNIALLALDLTQSLTQRSDGYLGDATLALQEVVSDLYDGFLSAADREGVKPPDHSVIPPLVKWGRPGFGPYAWPAPSAALFNCGAGVVNMPPAYATHGLAAWPALGHETAGHQILHADEGLHEQLAESVRETITEANKGPNKNAHLTDKKLREALADYWAGRIDETASDVMGVVNMGPAAAIGLIAYFRALAWVGAGGPQLRTIQPDDGVHPAPLARGYLMASALGLCSFEHSDKWRKHVSEEVDLDQADGRLPDGLSVGVDAIKASADLAASAILTSKVKALENHCLQDIQDWRESDQQIAQILATHAILGGRPLDRSAHSFIYAAHGVAAAVMAASATGDTRTAQYRMLRLVAAMHRSNPAWSALPILHSGDALNPHWSAATAVAARINGARPVAFSLGGSTPPWQADRSPQGGASTPPWAAFAQYGSTPPWSSPWDPEDDDDGGSTPPWRTRRPRRGGGSTQPWLAAAFYGGGSTPPWDPTPPTKGGSTPPWDNDSGGGSTPPWLADHAPSRPSRDPAPVHISGPQSNRWRPQQFLSAGDAPTADAMFAPDSNAAVDWALHAAGLEVEEQGGRRIWRLADDDANANKGAKTDRAAMLADLLGEPPESTG